jgi:hypothetical protein
MSAHDKPKYSDHLGFAAVICPPKLKAQKSPGVWPEKLKLSIVLRFRTKGIKYQFSWQSGKLERLRL